jgi:hypothetical protein
MPHHRGHWGKPEVHRGNLKPKTKFFLFKTRI